MVVTQVESAGRFLKYHREMANLTQDEVVAASQGVSKTYLSYIENGKKNPPIETVIRIAEAIAQAGYDKRKRQAAA